MKANRLFIGWMMVAALVLAACDSGTPTATPPAANLPALDDSLLSGVSAATQSGDFQDPLDSTPDFDATTIYFTARNAQGSGVFKVPAQGGAAEVVVVGAPFVAARGIVMSADGTQIFVADPGAVDSTGTAGQIFAMQASGGAPTPVRGSAGTDPQNMAVVVESGQAIIYFTGKDPSSGQAAVMSLPTAGADTPTIVLKGAPLSNPDGIVVTTAGVIYVADGSTGIASDGKVFKIEGGNATAVMDQLRTGNPAGMALSSDESILLVSAVSPDPPSSQVHVLELAGLRTGIITKGISQSVGSGGLHASPSNKKVFSWVSTPMGPIFKIDQQ